MKPKKMTVVIPNLLAVCTVCLLPAVLFGMLIGDPDFVAIPSAVATIFGSFSIFAFTQVFKSVSDLSQLPDTVSSEAVERFNAAINVTRVQVLGLYGKLFFVIASMAIAASFFGVKMSTDSWFLQTMFLNVKPWHLVLWVLISFAIWVFVVSFRILKSIASIEEERGKISLDARKQKEILRRVTDGRKWNQRFGKKQFQS